MCLLTEGQVRFDREEGATVDQVDRTSRTTEILQFGTSGSLH